MSYKASVQQIAVLGELDRYRAQQHDGAGMTHAEITTLTGWSMAKVGRIFRGVTELSLADLNRLIKLFRIDKDEAKRLRALRNVYLSKVDAWWENFDGISKDYERFLVHENSAVKILSAQGVVLDGILQCDEYFAETRKSDGGGMTAADVSEIRNYRRRMFERGKPPRCTYYFSEAAIRLGSPETVRAQLQHLLRIGSRPAIQLRLIRFETGIYPDSLEILTPSQGEPLVTTSVRWSTIVLEGSHHLRRAVDSFEVYDQYSLSREATLRFIESELKGTS